MSEFIRSTLAALDDLDIPNSLPNATADSAKLETVFTVIIGILATVALLIIVVGGFKFITSRGDPGAAAKARNTIIYGGVGLILAMLAFGIVRFVVGAV